MFKRPAQQSGLDYAIESALSELSGLEATSEEYAHVVDQLEKLCKLKDAQRPERVSRDTLAIVAGNLAGILLIVGHERAHIVTSKALSFVLKSR